MQSDATGAADNTLMVFLSDNGGSCEGHRDNKIERLGKPWVSSVIPRTAPDGSPVVPGDFPNLRLGSANTYGSYGVRWASVSNTPFRRHKSWVHEGGIATPCIVRWPDGSPNHGTLCHNVAHVIDLMPTFVELAGAKYPTKRAGQDVPSLPGQSLAPLLTGKPISRDYLCWEHEGNRAIRQGRWKLVSEYPGTWSSFYPYTKRGRWELYDMEHDRTELNDLAAQRPQVVSRLSGLYENWAQRSQVVAWDKLEQKTTLGVVKEYLVRYLPPHPASPPLFPLRGAVERGRILKLILNNPLVNSGETMLRPSIALGMLLPASS